MAMRSNFLCRLEVYRGPNECTLRSFSIEEAPSTILEMVNLLKSYDLRLQHGTFELTAAHGQDEAPRKLLSDDDVVAFFSVHSCPCFVFTAVIDHCDSGVGSSMLVDDPLVLLSIQHSDGGVPTTKRFIPPRREIWKALLVAVRGAIQQVLLPGQQLTLFSTEGNGKALTEICSEEAAALLIRSCMAQRSVCHLTYNIGRGDTGAKVVGATLAEVDKKEDKNKVPISTKNDNDQLPTCAVVNARSKNMDQNLPPEPAKAETVKPVAVPEPAKAETVKPVAVPEPAKAETVKPVAVPEPAKAETVKPVAVPEPAKAETVKPVAVPEPAKAETVKPVAVPEPAKAETVKPVAVPEPAKAETVKPVAVPEPAKAETVKPVAVPEPAKAETVKPVAVPEPAKAETVKPVAVPEPAKAETVKPVAVPEPAKAETVKPVAVPEPAKAETVKPVAVPEPAKAETVKPVAVPEPAKAETVKPVAVPEPAKAETVKPVAVPEPAKAEIVEKPNLSLAVSVFLKDRDPNAFAMKKSPALRDSEIGSGRLLEPLFTKDVLVGEGNAASRPWNNAKVLPTGFKGGDGDAVTAKNGKGADESPLTSKNATECISGKKNCSDVEEELPNEVVVEVACSLEKKAPVRFFLTWKKASPKVFESFRNECLNALHLTDMDNIIIYDSNGVPLCNPSGVTAMVGEAIRKKRSCINVTAVRGHPCTSGLPLQCLFTWGTQQVMRALVLRPGCALEDMRSALAEECGLKEKDMGELSFRLVERGELDDMELTPDNVYKELKRVAENSCVVRIAILDRRRTSLIAFVVRTLCDAASAFAAEVEHVFGGHFTEMDVVPILTRCCDLSPLEGDVKRYVDAVISNLEGSQVLRSDNVVKAVLDPVSICGEEVALSFLNRCIAVTELMSSHRPFEVLMRFFRRLYRSIEYPERTESGVPLNVVTRQLAYAGLSDARWLLFRDQPFSSVVHEKDFVEMLQRVYAGNPSLVCRVAVACRLSGISSLKSRRVMAKEERDVRRQHCRKEIAHAFDGIRPDEVMAYIHHYRLHGKPNHCCLLGTVSTLLANCSERLSSQWFVERVTQRCSVTMETMLQNFEDAQIPLPLLYQLCWDVLRPELHHLTLLPESHVASAFAYWAMFAVQLLCINRNLEFPPVPLVDLKEFTWVVPEKASADTVTDEADGAVAIALPTPQPAGVAKKKIKYKYSYLCHDLRRDQRFLPMIR
ncbi:hypothetical protein, conserved [Trypanosoma brucei brucei TREU927]|uniref:Metal-binding domain-containing protein n=1 Tax=Trypanosoma brucei brucei (strain 927/4 GUTat10.1) TaxID=185431 RepID=Q4GZE3_TRYB2|nr:hypothetical protein, conserved [Trypanosoma brucei brucei TREU927]CAJ15986.1 hypothetical protein, conserved [Trypanosoma brucei brucei TREU927]